ncbi:MAG TPA: hypothetical protein VM713_04260, partial [Steroidobacteraceae bacterium]|nr:hypothetical protein [Steroidobacteraceae bacterium]
DQLHIGALRGDLSCGLDAVQLGHGDDENCNARRKLQDLRHGIAAVAGGSNYPDIGLRSEVCDQAIAYDGVVIGDEDGNCCHG